TTYEDSGRGEERISVAQTTTQSAPSPQSHGADRDLTAGSGGRQKKHVFLSRNAAARQPATLAYKQKGTASLRCPSAPPVWLPQHSRRPAVITPTTRLWIRQAAYPRDRFEKTG